jgi:hypothetical protein
MTIHPPAAIEAAGQFELSSVTERGRRATLTWTRLDGASSIDWDLSTKELTHDCYSSLAQPGNCFHVSPCLCAGRSRWDG